MGSSNILIDEEITGRVALDVKGPITFIESSQLICAKHSCWCNVVVFHPRGDQGWRFGILQAIHLLSTSKEILLFEWTGPVTKSGVPDFVHKKIISEWSDIAHHFHYKSFSIDSVQLLFVNQVRGILIGNLNISNNCRNEVDGGIQCSVDGPDLFNPTVPKPSCKNQSELEKLFDSIELQYDEVPFSKTYFENGNLKRRLKKINERVRSDAPKVVKEWNNHASYSTRSCQMGSFFVVTNNDLSDYKKEQSIMLQSTLKDKFLIPDLSSYDDQSNPFQFFSPLTASQ